MDVSLSYECFWEGASTAAHKAMDDHARGEYDEFALHGGVAVERLAKAVLVSKNPIYIAELLGSTEMLFHLGGDRAAGKVRTIGAAEALARLRTLDVLGADKQLDLLIDVRNGVAHTTSAEQAKSLMPVLAQTVETLPRMSIARWSRSGDVGRRPPAWPWTTNAVGCIAMYRFVSGRLGMPLKTASRGCLRGRRSGP
ncbi:hypothetical protein AB0H77_31365 [Streptomyces sp. NPDC050844]|uniref:hypothetical protein n=1 Tax=Streptomyces sp. NPDC050844 TaxID=3155790 RepID=UPI0033ECD145